MNAIQLGTEPRQLRGFTVHDDGTICGPSGQVLTPFPVKGYLRVTAFRNGKHSAEPVHRLVCEAFNGAAPEGKPLVLHRNGDHLDNRAENLYWGNQADNERDKKSHGRAMLGEKHHQAVLTEADVRQIREMSGSSTEVAPIFGVTPSQIRNIRAGRSWGHVK